MEHYPRFIVQIKNIIFNAVAKPGLDTETISKIILENLSKENTSRKYEQEFSGFLEEKKINHIIHFTHVDNIKNILKWGLIPRIYLKEEIIKLELNPIFSDSQRFDKREEVNCLSISFPNYKMFFTKAKFNQDNWAVILFDLNVIKKHLCEFTDSNLASKNTKGIKGIEGIKKMFFNSQLRGKLGLPDYYPTNPQAEVLESSVIPPSWIKEIHLKSGNILNKIINLNQSENIKILVNNKFFGPREDYQYW
jgi:hypothetical protein